MRTFLYALILVLLATGIGYARQESGETLNIQLGRERVIAGSRVKIKFLSIVEDSRCPINARCIWAGTAKVRVAVSKGRAAASVVELELGSEPLSATVYGYRLSLVDLRPQKGDPRPILKKTAAIFISRR